MKLPFTLLRLRSARAEDLADWLAAPDRPGTGRVRYGHGTDAPTSPVSLLDSVRVLGDGGSR